MKIPRLNPKRVIVPAVFVNDTTHALIIIIANDYQQAKGFMQQEGLVTHHNTTLGIWSAAHVFNLTGSIA